MYYNIYICLERRKKTKTMTTIITTIIITLIVHSAIGCAIYLATKNNETILAYWGAGILCLISNGVTAIIYVIRKALHKKNFKALLVDKEGNLYYCESNKADDFIYDLNLKFAREVVAKHAINDGWRKSDCNKMNNGWVLSARYCPKKVCIAEGAKELK